jgi:hypothetical protein
MELSDEHQMEYDMLTAMYPEHVSEVGPSTIRGMTALPGFTVNVSKDGELAPELKLSLALPELYPSEAPAEIRVESIATVRRLQVAPLQAELKAMCTPGEYVLVALLQRCQEFLHETDAAAMASEREARQREINAADTDPTIRLGQSVTTDLYVDWRAKFDAERAANRSDAVKAAAKANKVTGKQMWIAEIAAKNAAFINPNGDGDDDDEGEDAMAYDTRGNGSDSEEDA